MILFVRNLVAKDFWLKLFSLALAVLIWITIKISTTKEVSPWSELIGRTADETVMTIPVRVPGNVHDISVNPEEVEVTLRGDPKLLEELKQRPGDVRAVVNLNGVQYASGLLRPVELILPQGVAYTHIRPEEVEVQVSSKAQ
jgi:YbbR domain-containing protein